jgi:hypothetical protein
MIAADGLRMISNKFASSMEGRENGNMWKTAWEFFE